MGFFRSHIDGRRMLRHIRRTAGAHFIACLQRLFFRSDIQPAPQIRRAEIGFLPGFFALLALCGAVIPIVDDRDMFVGVVPREDIVQYFAEKSAAAAAAVTA